MVRFCYKVSSIREGREGKRDITRRAKFRFEFRAELGVRLTSDRSVRAKVVADVTWRSEFACDQRVRFVSSRSNEARSRENVFCFEGWCARRHRTGCLAWSDLLAAVSLPTQHDWPRILRRWRAGTRNEPSPLGESLFLYRKATILWVAFYICMYDARWTDERDSEHTRSKREIVLVAGSYTIFCIIIRKVWI